MRNSKSKKILKKRAKKNDEWIPSEDDDEQIPTEELSKENKKLKLSTALLDPRIDLETYESENPAHAALRK